MIRSTLERTPVAGVSAPPVDGLDGLRVVDRCPCGCDSVDFAHHDPERPVTPVADGIGTTPDGGMVGVIVWGREGEVTGLEIYDLGAGEDDLRLPDASTIGPLDEGSSG